MKYVEVTDIDWDLEEETVDHLPDTVLIQVPSDVEEDEVQSFIEEYLSSTFEWTTNSFSYLTHETLYLEMLDHIKDLMVKNQGHVLQDIPDGEFPFYDAENKMSHISQEVNSIEKYWESLHELGHLELNHKVPSNWDEEAKMEIEAWDYVIKNSVVRIPKATIKKWEKERIKGSWE